MSQTELMHWLKLSPALIGGDGNYLLPQAIDLCPEKDSRYQGCNKQWGGTPSVQNAKANISAMEKALHDLDTYPAYARKWQEFGIWVAKAQLAYLESGSASALEESYGSVDPRIACSALLGQIRNTKTTEEVWPLVWGDWHNCVLDQERKHIGDYPQEAWDAFLKANGVHEQPIPETAD